MMIGVSRDVVTLALLLLFPAVMVAALYAMMACRSVRRQRAAAAPDIRYYFVEGAIGAGKSTLLERIEGRLRALGLHNNLVVVQEPLDAWTHVDGHNILELFYTNPERWAYSFQVHAMSTRVEAVRRATVNAIRRAAGSLHESAPLIVLCERSVHTDRHVFVETLVQDGKISGAEKAMYARAFDFFTRLAYPGNTAGVIYLRTTPQTCNEHIRTRERAEEASIPFTYLERLHAAHESAIAREDTWDGAPRLTLTVNGALPSDDAVADSCAQQVYEFITKEPVSDKSE